MRGERVLVKAGSLSEVKESRQIRTVIDCKPIVVFWQTDPGMGWRVTRGLCGQDAR